jgi:hypothetical protein
MSLNTNQVHNWQNAKICGLFFINVTLMTWFFRVNMVLNATFNNISVILWWFDSLKKLGFFGGGGKNASFTASVSDSDVNTRYYVICLFQNYILYIHVSSYMSYTNPECRYRAKNIFESAGDAEQKIYSEVQSQRD